MFDFFRYFLIGFKSMLQYIIIRNAFIFIALALGTPTVDSVSRWRNILNFKTRILPNPLLPVYYESNFWKDV